MDRKQAKRRAKQRRHRARGPGPQRLSPPKTRLKELFTTMTAVTTAGDRALAQTPAEGNELVRFDAEVLTRGVNAVKSARLLLEHAHWEHAAGPVRQLFELLVNLEHLARLPDREAAVFRYGKYGLLQMVRSQLTALAYAEATGRPVDAPRLATLQSLLDTGFPEFRRVTPKGKVIFSESWCDKRIKALATESPGVLRWAQYEQLFVLWSEQIHAAPAALLGGIFPGGSAGALEEVVALDDRRVAETGTMAVTLFTGLWQTLPTVARLDEDALAEWMRALLRQAHALGAPPPRLSGRAL